MNKKQKIIVVIALLMISTIIIIATTYNNKSDCAVSCLSDKTDNRLTVYGLESCTYCQKTLSDLIGCRVQIAYCEVPENVLACDYARQEARDSLNTTKIGFPIYTLNGKFLTMGYQPPENIEMVICDV